MARRYDVSNILAPPPSSTTKRLFGVVASISPLSVTIGGDTQPTVGIASTVACAVDDRVIILAQDNVLTIVGVVGGSTGHCFAGEVVAYAGATAPAGWLMCDGSQYLQASYPALYTAIGSAYGEADTGYFRVPDLRGKVPMGASTAHALASTGGEETHVLTVGELPSHTHPVNLLSTIGGTVANPGGYLMTDTNTAAATNSGSGYTVLGVTSGATGSDTAHNNMQPYLALNHIISTGAGL